MKKMRAILIDSDSKVIDEISLADKITIGNTLMLSDKSLWEVLDVLILQEDSLRVMEIRKLMPSQFKIKDKAIFNFLNNKKIEPYFDGKLYKIEEERSDLEEIIAKLQKEYDKLVSDINLSKEELSHLKPRFDNGVMMANKEKTKVSIKNFWREEKKGKISRSIKEKKSLLAKLLEKFY